MSERQLATIRKIAEIKPIEKADAIEAVRVDGWWVVAKKGEFQVGDLAVYLEVDSWVPTELAPFLTKPGHEPKEFEGVKGELVGPGIQGNSYGFSEHRFFVYDIYDIEQQKYLLPYERQKLCNEIGLDCVPTMPAIFKMDESVTINDLLEIADGNSFVTKTKVEREGFVFKSMTEHDVSFKVISNKWLLKNE